MFKSFLANWKTSTVGVIGAILVAVSQTPNLQNGGAKEWLVALGTSAVPLLLGLFSGDADKGDAA